MARSKNHFFLMLTFISLPALHSQTTHHRYRRRIPSSSFDESNHIYVPEQTSYSPVRREFSPQIPNESSAQYMKYNQKQLPNMNYQQPILNWNTKHSQNTNLERQLNENDMSYTRRTEHQSPDGKHEYNNYILTAGGKESIYGEDVVDSYRPEYEQSYSNSKVESTYKPQEMTTNGKRIQNASKNYNRHKYSYSNSDSSDDKNKPNPTKARSFTSLSIEKPPPFGQRTFDSGQQPGLRNEQSNEHRNKDIWRQLGPNVEMSSSVDGSARFANRQFPDKTRSEVPKKMFKKPRKLMPKHMRTMSPQHALYVATIPKTKGGLFDHGNILKQSDKFEVADVMNLELEKENQGPEVKTRIKLESPKKPDDDSFQYFHAQQTGNSPTPFSINHNLQNNPNKFAYNPFLPHFGPYPKGFVRNIEIETTASGKKTIPAYIIPLTPEQASNPLFSGDNSFYINQPDVLNPKPKQNIFPYDIVPNRYNDAPLDNYHQNYSPTQSPDYYPFVSHQNFNLYPRLPFSIKNQPASSTAPPKVERFGNIVNTKSEQIQHFESPNSKQPYKQFENPAQKPSYSYQQDNVIPNSQFAKPYDPNSNQQPFLNQYDVPKQSFQQFEAPKPTYYNGFPKQSFAHYDENSYKPDYNPDDSKPAYSQYDNTLSAPDEPKNPEPVLENFNGDFTPNGSPYPAPKPDADFPANPNIQNIQNIQPYSDIPKPEGFKHEFVPNEFHFEEEDSKYLSPSASNNYFASVTHPSTTAKSSQDLVTKKDQQS